MRRFVEEIRVENPEIASKIVKALETRELDNNGFPIGTEYEVDMYEHNRDFDALGRPKPDERFYISLKIFIKEDVTNE